MVSDSATIASSLTDPTQFGPIFDRHATVLHRYLVRRVGPGEADQMLGDLFLIAFENRHQFDLERSSARPAVREGGDITMELNDAFYGERRYEATDTEGHRWHFAERFESIVARGGQTPDPDEPPSA